ncbi:MAG: fructosamine kinase family protein [Candidatus Thorarchaeota archaeon]
MSKAKTSIEIGDVKLFLIRNFSSQIKNLEFLKGGEFSQAFSFDSVKGSFVIKLRNRRIIGTKKNPFEKEILAYKNVKLRDDTIPIPNIVSNGTFSGEKRSKIIYCIVEKAHGNFVHLFPPEKHELVDLNLIDVLHRIHSIDISNTKGYGNWFSFQEARFNSMSEHIIDVIEKQRIYTNKRYSTGIFEKNLYIKGVKRIEELVQNCSKYRYLIHGDYGYDNVLADVNCNISSVFDWEHSLFGDFVYDIAWLDFWQFRKENHYANLYKKMFEDDKNLDFKNYEERLLCYKLYIGMTAAGFFSESNQKEKYNEAKERILELL